MSVEKAKKNFLDRSGPRKLNCAESVAHAFKDKVALSEDELCAFEKFGAGRAPEDYCGAFYAARYILERHIPHRVKAGLEQLHSAAGSLKCREIRALKKLSCLECVEKAAEIVEAP